MTVNEQYILDYSYGKDSGACIHVVKDILKLPLDRIITADVWATDTIPAVYPEMWEWQNYADDLIYKRWGVKVEHLFATEKDGTKRTYDSMFYQKHIKGARKGKIYGFPKTLGAWCNSRLKVNTLNNVKGKHYIGIAFDEDERIERHKNKPNIIMPLVDAQWTEGMCYDWCKKNGLLSPTYETSTRGGCWFCHNQGVDALRELRKNHPELWEMLLKYDDDSPMFFKANKKTVHDYEMRFECEEEGYCSAHFKWKELQCPHKQLTIGDYEND